MISSSFLQQLLWLVLFPANCSFVWAFCPTTTTTATTATTATIRLFLPMDATQLWELSSSSSRSEVPSLQCDASLSDQTFAELYEKELPDWLLEKCHVNGWEYPTLIQERALDLLLRDENPPNSLVIQAQTGSGKTLTYLLPLLAKIQPQRRAVQAMIVVPTRELGLQVATVAKRLAAGRKIMIMSLLQGSQLRRQRAWAWAETPHVVIGTPTELLDMVQYGGLPRINSINYVVVDEVDACLVHTSGAALTRGEPRGGAATISSSSATSALHILLSKFLSPTYSVDDGSDDDYLLSKTGKRPRRKFRHRQTVFASATIPQHRHFLKQCQAQQWTLERPVFVCTSPGEALPPTLQHAYMVCASKKKKVTTLRRILTKLKTQGGEEPRKKEKKVLVFCDPSRPMEEMAMTMAHDLEGLYCQEGKTDLDNESTIAQPIASVLRLDDSLTQRAGATNAFKSDGNFRALFTADLAARGLDISGITHVIHFDLPLDADTYLHRSGRAGRLGQSGQVVSIITPDQEFVLNRLSNALSLGDVMKCVGRQTSKAKKTEMNQSNKD